MLYLSAQPDDFYFTWQLELQIFNFNQLGIAPNNIHVLIGYNPKIGLQPHLQELIEQNKDKADFFIYPDNRVNKNYPSSLRPHIIAQHFIKYPWLENEAIFYHDSDIIFRELPGFEALLKDNFWYVSDTRSYLDTKYIKRTADEVVLKKMCEIIQVSLETIVSNDDNCGGAQYLLKNVPVAFWEKVENDSEIIYQFLCEDNCRKATGFLKEGKKLSQYKGIQAWCTDMWVVFWNAFYFNRQVKISEELDFCWSTTPAEDWFKKKILHYSGAVDKEDKLHFRKGNYYQYSPVWDSSLSLITKESSSYGLVELIDNFKANLKKSRIRLTDVTFLIPIRIDSKSRLENLKIICEYLDRYLETNILIYESDTSSKVQELGLPECCRHIFDFDENPMLHHTKINNHLIALAKTPIVALYDTDVVFSIQQILSACELIRTHQADAVSPYDGEFVSVDGLFKIMFGKILDISLLTANKKKFYLGVRRSNGGAVFLHKDAFKKAGMDNEYFEGWGPEDVERVKRMKNLGYKVKRIDGPLFHLPHERKENSSYNSMAVRENYMEEYFKVGNMRKDTLATYISSWPWMNK